MPIRGRDPEPGPGAGTRSDPRSTSRPSSLYIDPSNGGIRWRTAAGSDNGRGVAGDIWAGNEGAEMWSAADSAVRDTNGTTRGREPSSANFLAWWDGDTTRELLDGTRIDKYGPGGDSRLLTGSGVHSNNGTKANPSLSGDILGDWREEVLWPRSDDNALRIYSTPIVTDHRFVTRLQDRMYLTGLAWQNTAYNQPPHPGFFLGSGSGSGSGSGNGNGNGTGTGTGIGTGVGD